MADTVVVRIDDKDRTGLRILVLIVTFGAFFVFLVFGVVVGLRQQSGSAGGKVLEKLLSGEVEDVDDLHGQFKQARAAYVAKMSPEGKKLADENVALREEVIQMIAGADCNLQQANQTLQTKAQTMVATTEQLTRVEPDNPYAYYLLALSYNCALCFPFGGDEKAIVEYQKAIELDPNYLEGRLHLGGSYKNLQNYQAAIPHLEWVVDKAPLCDSCWLDLGEVYLGYGARTKAREALETANGLMSKDDRDRIRLEKLLDDLEAVDTR